MDASDFGRFARRLDSAAMRVAQQLRPAPRGEEELLADSGLRDRDALQRHLIDIALAALGEGLAVPIEAVRDGETIAWRQAGEAPPGEVEVGDAASSRADIAICPTDRRGRAGTLYRKVSNERARSIVMLNDTALLANQGFAVLERAGIVLVRTDYDDWTDMARALARGLLTREVGNAETLWLPLLGTGDSGFALDDSLAAIDFALRLTRPRGVHIAAGADDTQERTRAWLRAHGWRLAGDPTAEVVAPEAPDAASGEAPSSAFGVDQSSWLADVDPEQLQTDGKAAIEDAWSREQARRSGQSSGAPPLSEAAIEQTLAPPVQGGPSTKAKAAKVKASRPPDPPTAPPQDPPAGTGSTVESAAMGPAAEEAVETPAVEAAEAAEVPAAEAAEAPAEALSEAPAAEAADTPEAPAEPETTTAEAFEAPESPPAVETLRLILTADTARLVDGASERWHRSLAWPDPRTHEFAGHRLAAVRRRLPVDWPQTMVEAFGDALAGTTFGDAPPPLQLFQAVRRLVIEAGDGVPDLPWEYLRLEGRFLAGLRLSIVRHVDARADVRPLRSTKPDPIAFAAANPSGEQQFNVGRHADKIFEAVSVGLKSRLHCDVDGLRDLAEDAEIQGFHFLGHGHPRHLAVEGMPDRVDAGQLSGWLSNADHLKFVFLGACHSGAMLPRDEEGTSGVAATIARETGVPVVAMQLSVSQHYSTEFAAAFYRHLEASDWDIEEAVYRTRRATYDTTLFGVPVLYADTKQAAAPVLDQAAPIRKIEQVVVKQIAAADAAKWLEAHEAAPALVQQVKQGGALPKPDLDDPIQAIREIARAVAQSATQEDRWVAESRRALAPRPADFDTLNVVIEAERELDRDWSVLETDGPVALALRQYAFEPTLIQRIVGELYAGRHVLLTGPVGTGKTTLARAIANALGDLPVEATAHAEWSTQDVVGGFWPQPQTDGSTQLVFRNGCVTEAVLRNWVQAGDEGVWRPTQQRTWLIIDELNRADMDRAMGPLFTALESRQLMVPTVSADVGAPTRTAVQIPRDFRILATMNTIDQHYLFRLSDALKRRFAFVEVPVVTDFDDERVKLERWLSHAFPEYRPARDPTMQGLRDFIRHARNIHSVGTAILKSAMGFVAATFGRIADTDDATGVAIRLDQAIAGSVLPTLENLSAIQRGQLTTFSSDLGALPALERLRPTDEPSLF